jgi:hypothetical protein
MHAHCLIPPVTCDSHLLQKQPDFKILNTFKSTALHIGTMDDERMTQTIYNFKPCCAIQLQN